MRVRLLAPLACAIALAGCGGSQSPLAPRSGPAHDISTLWWWMLGVSAVVFAGAVFLIVLAAISRRREGLPVIGTNDAATTRLVVIFGMGIPIVVLVAL